ncbi:OmpA family protein [Paraburkholderia sp.]|uniref:OmpA family protein n=1 Tax=Paraburkholderia sp. TaxID=1926495 RepID=UPI002393215A|nr:OmpA family protein [Paraburkholderia sp.]MDE1181203.1 OmpA family protein [Paraburkholderia sp.]
MSINVIQLIRSAMPDSVVMQLASRFGLPSDVVRNLTSSAAPALVAALMHKGATLEGARSLFATLLSPEVNAHIGEQLSLLLGTTAGMNQLETVGRQLLERTVERRIDGLSDVLSTQVGAPMHASHALTGIVGATLFGVLKRHFVEGRGNVGQLPTLLGHQLPLIGPFLNDGLLSALGLGGVSVFTSAILPQLKAVSAHIEHPTPPAAAPLDSADHAAHASVQVPDGAVVREHRRSHKRWWWLLAAIAAVLAFLCLRGCNTATQRDAHAGADVDAAALRPASAAAGEASGAIGTNAASDAVVAAASGVIASDAASGPAAEAAPTVDSTLTFTVDPAAKPALSATVGTEAEKTQLLDALTRQFGASGFTANVTVDPATRPAGWLAHLGTLLPLMALPGAEVKVDGARVELGGTAANAKLGWLERLKSLFGASYQIGAFNADQAVASATQSFREAIERLHTANDPCATADIAKVLNLQVINFASASTVVPASAADDLRRSAAVLSACAGHGKVAEFEVAGYSDNVGGTQANLQLSKKRAQSVRAFLVASGVPAASLRAQGYGATHPVADNATGSGRFANRRIEFVAVQQ